MKILKSLWGEIYNESFAIHQQKAVMMGNQSQNNEQTITAASALPTTKAKSNCRALTVANFLLVDRSSDDEDL